MPKFIKAEAGKKMSNLIMYYYKGTIEISDLFAEYVEVGKLDDNNNQNPYQNTRKNYDAKEVAYIPNPNRINTVEEMAQVLDSLIDVLQCLQFHSVLHGDLWGSNLLWLKNEKRFVVIDFNMAQIIVPNNYSFKKLIDLAE